MTLFHIFAKRKTDNAMAREFTIGYLTYEVIESGRVKVIRCDKSVTEIVIPENVEGYKVTTIASEAFESCEVLKSIVIPDSVTYIGSLAFWNCNSLTSLTIPSSVNIICPSAFYGCNSLISVTCFSNNPPKIGNDTFYPKISVLYVPNTTKYIYIKYGWKECFKEIITEEEKQYLEEYLKSKCEFCIQLEKNCKSIGATIISEKEFSYDIFVPENIDIDQMFLLFKSIVDFSLVIERTSWLILDKDSNPFVCNYYIIDIEGNKLVAFKESLSVIQFLQDDIGYKEFKKGNIIKQAEKYLYCYLENRKIKRLENDIENIIKDGVNNINALFPKGNSIEEKVCNTLKIACDRCV